MICELQLSLSKTIIHLKPVERTLTQQMLLTIASIIPHHWLCWLWKMGYHILPKTFRQKYILKIQNFPIYNYSFLWPFLIMQNVYHICSFFLTFSYLLSFCPWLKTCFNCHLITFLSSSL